MSATHLGVVNSPQPEGTTQIDENGITHTVVREMPTVTARDINTHITPGLPIQVMDNELYLRSINIADQPGDLSKVTYTYAASRVYPVGGVGSPDSLIGPAAQDEGDVVKYDIDYTLEPVSILRAPRYENISLADKRVLAAMIQFGPIDKDGNQIRRFLSSDTLAAECANKIEAGTVSILMPAVVMNITQFNVQWGREYSASGFGTTTLPVFKEFKGSSDFDFLFAGMRIDGDANGIKSQTITLQSAPRGQTWDSDLYSS